MTDCATLSVAEAAAMLGVGRISLYKAIRQGRVPALRIGRKPRLRIPRRALERLLDDPRQEHPCARPGSSHAGVVRGEAFASPQRVYPRGNGGASRSRMLFAADGRPGGVLVERLEHVELVKKVSARSHMLRKPVGWALDVGVLREAERCGATLVRIEDRDSGRGFVASLTAFYEHGFPLRRGYGEQRGLQLSFWRIEDPRQRPLFAEVVR
jgi:excisionase family DNA binding protein